jgi:hypothetical protein
MAIGPGGCSSRASLTTGKARAAGGIWMTGLSGSIAEDVSQTIATTVATEMPSDATPRESRTRRMNPRNGDVTIDAPFHLKPAS